MNNKQPVTRIEEDLYTITSNTSTYAKDRNGVTLVFSAQKMLSIYEYCVANLSQLQSDATKAEQEESSATL